MMARNAQRKKQRSPIEYALAVLLPPLALLLRGQFFVALASGALAVVVWMGVQARPDLRPLALFLWVMLAITALVLPDD